MNTLNPKLKQLSFYDNQLSTIDLSKNTALQKLWAFKNPNLTSLDLTNNTNLTYLSVYSNNMPSLDVSMLTKLQTLLCFGNKLTTLDVSNNTALTELSCYTNQLSQLDLGQHTKLQSLSCFNNQLTTLDLSNNTALTYLSCYNNRLTSLTISSTAIPNITTLNISKNALASFDLSNFTKLDASTSGVATQKRRMLLYTDGTDAYMKVESGIDASKISDGKIILNGDTTAISSFTVGTADADGLVPLKFSNGAARKRLFNWINSKVTPAFITYNYTTGSSLTNMTTMDVTDTVECYLLPMSAEYGSVNLPYDVVLPTGATAYAISATSVKAGSSDNYATLKKIAGEGEVVAANTPMLIQRSADSNTLFALNQGTGTATSAASNLLKGTQDAAIASSDNYYVLGINNSTSELGFWRTTQSKIGNWRAYLDLTGTTASAKGFLLSFESPATGISSIETSEKQFDKPWYTLDGRTLSTTPTQRGVYIHNGKKIVISK